MVVWKNYYRFSAEEVEALATTENTSGTYPYVLTVHFKSGNKLAVYYADEKSRKEGMLDLSLQIDSEKRRDAEKIQNALFLLQGSANRIEKRQLRIWKQLKELLGIQPEEV